MLKDRSADESSVEPEARERGPRRTGGAGPSRASGVARSVAGSCASRAARRGRCWVLPVAVVWWLVAVVVVVLVACVCGGMEAEVSMDDVAEEGEAPGVVRGAVGAAAWQDAPDEIWVLVFAKLNAYGLGVHDIASRREWVRTWCRCAQTCRKFRSIYDELAPLERFSHSEWPRLSRRLAGSRDDAARARGDSISRMAALTVGDASGTDWADVVSVQMRQLRRMENRFGGNATGGPGLVRLSRSQPLGAASSGHTEWVTCTKFFPGNLPYSGSRGSEEKRRFSESCSRGALGGQTGLVSCSYDGTVRFWDLSRHGSYNHEARYSEDGSVGGIRCCAEFRPAQQPEAGPNHNLFSCLAFDEECGVIAVGDIHDNTVKRWVLNETGTAASKNRWPVGHAFRNIPARIGLKDCIDLNGRLLVVGCEDGRMRMYSPDEEKPLLLGTLLGHAPDQMISCVKLLGDGSHALSASGDRSIRLWDVEAQCSTLELSGHGRQIFCCDTDRHAPGGQGGNMIISGGRDKTARVWDRRTGQCEHVLEGHSGTVVCLRFDDMLLATAGGAHF